MIKLPYEEKDDVAIKNEGYWIETGWNEWETDEEWKDTDDYCEHDKWVEYDEYWEYDDDEWELAITF